MECEFCDTSMPGTKHKEHINANHIVGYSTIFYRCRNIERPVERISASHAHGSRSIDNLNPLTNRIENFVIQCVPVRISCAEVVSRLGMTCQYCHYAKDK